MCGSAPERRQRSRWCSASCPLSAKTVRMRAMTAKAARNSRSKTGVSLTLAAVAAQATGTPSPSVAMWYLVPLLARSVGLGPVRSPPRLARTEQVSRIGVEDQVGVAAQHADQQGVHLRQQARPGPARQATAQGRAAGLVLGGGQAAPGVPSRRKRRRVATTRKSVV